MMFLKRIRELREKRKLTQLQLSIKLNVSQETISGYEIGKALPPADMLIALANELKTSVDYLLERTDLNTTIDNVEFSQEELDIISTYRQLNRENKICITKMFNGLKG